MDLKNAILAVNGAESTLQVVIGHNQAVLLAQEIYAPGQAMKYLAPILHQALEFLGLNFTDLKGLAYVRGPGSFTGLRLVLAHVFGLARGCDLPVAALDYLPLLALGPGPLLTGELWVVTHSRRNQVYAQGFKVPEVKAISEPKALGLADLEKILNKRTKKVYLLGSGVRKNQICLQNKSWEILPILWDKPLTEVLLAQGTQAKFTKKIIPPLYLRPSDAEENLPHIARSRGLDLGQAQKMLFRDS
ncbi:tRNA (adenosine(37)-N6)-threonylcarbamoyltransferase complex dimerization subunit type 1 TsaB [Desulfovulcanus sp.]